MSPLGETLQRARLSKGLTFEDAERVTRIPRKYLEALELENFGILPAPVFARGFLRSYADYLGLDSAALLPFFPVGHVEEPTLAPLPEVSQPGAWNASGVIAFAVMGLLVLLVVALYSIGREDSNPTFRTRTVADQQTPAPVIVPDGSPVIAGPAQQLPDLIGLTAEEAITNIEATGATYVILEIREGTVPVGQVISQSPQPETEVGPGDLVTISVSR